MPSPSVRLVEHVRQQASACFDLGSPFYGTLLTHVADDVEAGGPAAEGLREHALAPGPAAIALRLLGTAHRLAIHGEAPDFAAHVTSTVRDGESRESRFPLLVRVTERAEPNCP